MGWQVQNATVLFAGNTIINPNGIFTYSSAPATGNLIASQAPATGTDSFGNHYLAGVASYGATFAAQLGQGFITLYSGSLAAGWTGGVTITRNALGDLLIEAAAGRQVLTLNNVIDDGSGNATFNGTVAVTALTVGGSSNVGAPSPNSSSSTGLPDGTIHGTSGAASAGTAHTHSPGSFAVGNGVHTHDLQNHAHPL